MTRAKNENSVPTSPTADTEHKDEEIEHLIAQDVLNEHKKEKDEIEQLMNQQMYGYRNAMQKTMKEVMDGVPNGEEQQRSNTQTI